MADKILYRNKVHGNKKEEYVYAYIPTEYARALGIKKGDWIEWIVDPEDMKVIGLRKLVTDEEWPDRRVMKAVK